MAIAGSPRRQNWEGGSLPRPPTIPCQSRRLVQNLVMDSLSGLFWDFRSLYQRRCGVVSDALSRQPSSSSTSLRRLWLRVAAQASGTSVSDVSASPDVVASRITRRRATATPTLLTCRGAAAKSTPLTRRGAAARSTPLGPSVVTSLSWPDRGHHVPALTVTSGGRGVGFDMHAWGRLVVLRRQFNSSFHLLHLSRLRFLAYISTRRAALSCVRTDGVLTSTLGPGRAAGDHSVQTAVRCEGMRNPQMCKCNGTK